jgi:hypothetical protein
VTIDVFDLPDDNTRDKARWMYAVVELMLAVLP